MPIPYLVARWNKRVTNKVAVHLAGHASIVELEHVGRRSGRVYRVPLNAFRTGDTLTVALTYGPRVDWLRNVRAAGGCRVRTGDEILTTGAPVDLPHGVGLARMPALARAVLRLLRVDRFVEMPVLESAPVAGAPERQGSGGSRPGVGFSPSRRRPPARGCPSPPRR